METEPKVLPTMPTNKRKRDGDADSPIAATNKKHVLQSATRDGTVNSSLDLTFDDALNRLMGHTSRPKTELDTENLKTLLATLIDLCDDDQSKWKSFVLALTYKRYHLKAPEAKISLKEAMQSANKNQDNRSTNKSTVGNGERSIFYIAIVYLFQCLLRGDKKNVGAIASAVKCLHEIAPYAGGCRDVCTLIEKYIGVVLSDEQMKRKREQAKEFFGAESMSLLVAYGVEHCFKAMERNEAKAALEHILRMAATLLEEDKKVLDARQDSGANKKLEQLPSTLHVFLPHRDRGKPSKKIQNGKNIPDRQFINSVAEILIWSQTSIMSSNNSFAGSYSRLKDAANLGMSNDSKAKAKASLQIMQTIIRKERQKFNTFARKQGFMLSDLFQHDKTALTLSQIRRGKDGDVTKLTKLATKARATTVLRLVNASFSSNPSKITRFESIGELVRAWSESVPKDSNSTESQDELAKLEQGILESRLKATLNCLKGAYKSTDRGVVVASLDSNVDSHVAALLACAAMSSWKFDAKEEDVTMVNADKVPDDGCQLHLPGGVVQTVDSFTKLCELLTALVTSNPDIFPSMANSDGSATMKAVVHVIDKHLEPNQTLLLFSSTIVELPGEFAEAMVKQGCSIHQHDVDDIHRRLDREGARRGDITISLSWDTHDDLDLHVFLPCGTRIGFDNRQSVEGKAYLDVDMNAWSPYSSEPVENVFVGDLSHDGEAPQGRYVVLVNNFSYHAMGHTSETEIPWVVVVDKNGRKQKICGKCVGQGESSDVVALEFDYTGRTTKPSDDESQQLSGEVSGSVNITTSIGQTLEALVQAIKALGQQEQLNETRQLLNDDGEETKENEETERPIVSSTFEVTNRDRNQILFFNLPDRFHGIVNRVFGGGDLADQAATSIAKRMVQDKINIRELKKAGYPGNIIESVGAKMEVVLDTEVENSNDSWSAPSCRLNSDRVNR